MKNNSILLGRGDGKKLETVRYFFLVFRVGGIIDNHANGKPCLVFCTTRKSTVQTANVLSQVNKTIPLSFFYIHE